MTFNKIVIPKKILSSIKSFNFCFFDNIRDLCINKTGKKSYFIIYTYNDEKKYHARVFIKNTRGQSGFIRYHINIH